MKKYLLCCLGLVLITNGLLLAQGIVFHGSARNSFYSYENDQVHNRVYQYGDFTLANPGNTIILNTAVRALSDFNETLTSEERFKAYTLNVRLKGLARNRLDLIIGRQFLHPGTVLGSLDGIRAHLHQKNLTLQLYGGIESYYKKSFEMLKTGDDFTAGGALEIRQLAATNWELLYLRKAASDGVFWQLAGLNAFNASLPKTILQFQAHYDLENSRLHRMLLGTRNSWSDRINTTLEFKSQFPQVYANSYFTIFSPKAYRQYRAGAAFQFIDGYYLNGLYQHIQFPEDSANQFFLTLQNGNGAAGFFYEDGYAGEQLGLSFDYGMEIFKNFMASIYIDYSKYRIEEIYEFDNQLGNAARLSYRFNKYLSADLEYQWLKNRFKEQDNRLLNHISLRW